MAVHFPSVFSETREQEHEEFLQPAFEDKIKVRLKNPDNRRDKLPSKTLFAKAGQLDKTVKELSKNDTKVRFGFFFVCYLKFVCSLDIKGGETQTIWIWGWQVQVW